ncbi:hypothetical protein EYR38_002245 [Pleurotus pulmonarius]|nr:hypothetical protein EYR38_002245 [Pleurotus pulmonarius]
MTWTVIQAVRLTKMVWLGGDISDEGRVDQRADEEKTRSEKEVDEEKRRVSVEEIGGTRDSNPTEGSGGERRGWKVLNLAYEVLYSTISTFPYSSTSQHILNAVVSLAETFVLTSSPSTTDSASDKQRKTNLPYIYLPITVVLLGLYLCVAYITNASQGVYGSMDPLSITVSVVSLIEVAKRIKDAVYQMNQNRRTIQELASALVDELAELQKLCQDKEEILQKIISSRRAEQMESKILVIGTENQATLRRLEASMSQLLVRSHTSGSFPASLLDRASPGGLEYQFLRLQVLKTVISLYQASITHPLMDLTHNGVCGVDLRVTVVPSRRTLIRSAIIEVLQLQQVLERQPSHLFTPKGANQLRRLASQLHYMDLNEDSLSIVTWMMPVYRTLMQRDPAYKPHVAWGHENLSKSRMGTLEGLAYAKTAVGIYEEMSEVSLSYALSLAMSRVALGLQYLANGEYDEFCESAMAALAMHRKIPNQPTDGDNLVVWEASEGPLSRSYPMAITEGWCLRTYAISLASTGRYSESLAVGAEAINCFNAIIRNSPNHPFPRKVLEHLVEHRAEWISRLRHPDQRSVSVSISSVRDPDCVDDGDFGGEPRVSTLNDILPGRPMVIIRPFDLYYFTGVDIGLQRIIQ